jgi:hypothetical protein
MFLAVICISKGQLAEADGFFEKCLSGIEKRTGKNSAATAKCLEQYAKLLQNQNRDEQASLLASRARHIREKLARR